MAKTSHLQENTGGFYSEAALSGSRFAVRFHKLKKNLYLRNTRSIAEAKPLYFKTKKSWQEVSPEKKNTVGGLWGVKGQPHDSSLQEPKLAQTFVSLEVVCFGSMATITVCLINPLMHHHSAAARSSIWAVYISQQTPNVRGRGG